MSNDEIESDGRGWEKGRLRVLKQLFSSIYMAILAT